jgi:hypothetical protein
MQLPRFALACTVVVLLSACASSGPAPGTVARLSPEELSRLQPTPKPAIPLADIVMWSKEGAKPDAIIRRLTETGTMHVLAPAQIVDLSRQGVDQAVIDHLVQVQEKARQATLATQLADRDAQAAAQLEQERERRRAMQQRLNQWNWGIGYGAGWGPGYYRDPFFRPWRRW